MSTKGTKISEAIEKTSLSGTEKFPISDGSGSPKAVTANTIKEFAGSPIQSVSGDFDLSSEGELSLYKQMAINSFTGGSTVEKGSSVSNVVLNWSLNKVPESLTLDGSSIDRTSTSKEVSGTFTSDTTFTLKATDARGVAKSAKTSISFLLKRYWGVSSKSTLTSADVLALGNSDWASKAMTATKFDCSGGKYPYYCIPASLGTPEFWVGGLKNTKVTSTELSVTNSSGYTETYNIFRLTDLQYGSDLSIEFK